MDPRQRSALLTFLYYMADSKYTADGNGYDSTTNITKSSAQRNRLCNPNAYLPPNSSLPSLRSNLSHKSQAMAGTSQFTLMKPTDVSRILNSN